MKAAELRVLGFGDGGVCSLDPRLKSGVRFRVTASREVRVIYAFAVNDDIKYIGVCDNSGTCFGHRMGRYQGMMGAGTNKRIAGKVREALSQGATVRILVWRPEQQLKVGDLPVDLVKGLENPLIALAKPAWNIHA